MGGGARELEAKIVEYRPSGRRKLRLGLEHRVSC
jgi:hypothetical protein